MPENKSYSERFNIGVAHLGGASLTRAEESFIGIIESFLKNPAGVSEGDKKLIGETFYILGNLANKACNFQEALLDFQKAHGLGFEKDDLARKIAWLHYLLGFLDKADVACKDIPEKETASHYKGEIALARGDYKAAIKHLQGLEKPEAKLALGLALEGLALEGAGKKEEAETCFQALKTDTPELFGQLMEQVDRYVGLEYYRLASHFLKRAEKIAPGDAISLFELGFRYYTIGMTDDAIRMYRTSIRQVPMLAAYGELASIYEKSNKVKEAKAFAEFGVRNFESDPTLVAILANCERRLGQEEKAKERIETALNEDIEDLHAKAELLNVLARIFDKQDKVDEAFKGFQACKDARKKTKEYTETQVDYPLQVIKQTLPLDLKALPQCKPGASTKKWGLVFFVGFARSGTTLLQQILDSHPNIQTVEEKSILTGPLRLLDKFEGGYPGALLNLSPDQIEYLRTLYFYEMAHHVVPEAGQVFVDKMPFNMIHIPAITTLFPEARVIFGLRHPYDVALSCLMQNFALNGAMANMTSLDSITRFYEGSLSLWNKCTAEIDFPYHYVRYENIVSDLEGEARKLTDFLGLEWSPAMLDYRKSAQKKGLINTPSYHQVIQPIYDKAVGRWRRYEKHFAPFQDRMAPFIKEFGYD